MRKPFVIVTVSLVFFTCFTAAAFSMDTSKRPLPRSLALESLITVDAPALDRSTGHFAAPSNAYGLAFAGEGLRTAVIEGRVTGSYYIAAMRHGLSVFDMQNPQAPVEVARHYVPEGMWSIDVQGSYAYLGTYSSLRIVDISSPLAPIETASLDIGLPWEDVLVDGSYAYLLSNHSEIAVVNIADPFVPLLVVLDNQLPEWGYGLAKSGDYLYVANGHLGIRTLDVTDPAKPVLVHTYADQPYVVDVHVDGNRLFAAIFTRGLDVLDITNPAAPVLLGMVTENQVYDRVITAGNLALMSHTKGVAIMDVSDPANPAVAGLYDSYNPYAGLTLYNDLVLVSSPTAGLQVVDYDPTAPAQVAEVPLPHSLLDIEVSGSLAYITHSRRGLLITAVSNPGAPTVLGEISFGRESYDKRIAVSAPYAYVVDRSNGFHIVDVSSPASPQIVYKAGMHYPQDVTLVGSRVVVSAQRGIDILDVTDPTSPVGLSHLSDPSGAMASAGSYLYVIQDSTRFQVYDLSVPYAPIDLGWLSLPGPTHQITMHGNFAYARSDSMIMIIDVADPLFPILAHTIPGLQEIGDMTIAGSLLFASRWRQGVTLYDISDPMAPTLELTEPSPSYDVGATFSGNMLYRTCLYGLVVNSLSGASVVLGDVNNDGVIASADIIGLVGYIFKGGPPPLFGLSAGDTNCNGAITSADILVLVQHVFRGGGAPVCN